MLPSSSLLALAVLLAQIPTEETRSSDAAAKPASAKEQSTSRVAGEEILVDWIHANDFSMIGLKPETYEYHVICGFRRGFGYLESRGIRLKYAIGERLTPQRLKTHKLLFINLVSAERAPFLVSEIQAIRSFVEQGGSLFVVTDHSNCYFHAHRLMPLFDQLGIRSQTSTACEQPPRTLGVGKGWITVTRFEQHPVTTAVTCLALQVGGCVDPRFAVAMTTKSSWADSWEAGIYGEENAPGFFGDFGQSSDEPSGPLGVVLARELGLGRIVIIADQNMLADTFINYADNFRLWLNSIAWLLHNESLREPASYEGWQSPSIALFEQFDKAAFGSPDAEGYYHAMSLLNRYHWTFANDRPLATADLIVLAENSGKPSAAEIAAFADHLRRGKNILLLDSDETFSLESEGILQEVIQNVSAAGTDIVRQPGKLVIDLPRAGSIHILTGNTRFDNANFPPPTRMPTPEERSRGEDLLKAVSDAISE